MARAIWKGNLSVGLVHVPVSAYKATEGVKETSTRWLHSKCSTPVNVVKRCAKCESELQMEDILNGIPQDDGSFVILTKEEISSIRVDTTDTIIVESTVPADSIDAIYVDSSYYLGPTKPTPGFALLRDAMRTQSVTMIGRLSIYGREHLVAVKPFGLILILQLLRTSNQIRSVLELPHLMSLQAPDVDAKQLVLAQQLLQLYTSQFNPQQNEDKYAVAFKELVAAKKSGKPTATSAPSITTPTMDLMSAIIASVAAKQPSPRPEKKKGKKTAA